MFSAVQQIHREFSRQPDLHDVMIQRKSELFAAAGRIGQIMGESLRNRYCSFGHYELCSLTSERRGQDDHVQFISFSPLLLIDPVEIPAEFHTLSSSQDENRWQSFLDWLCEKVDIAKRSVNRDLILHMQHYFQLMQDPVKAKEALKFALARALIKEKEGSFHSLYMLGTLFLLYAVVVTIALNLLVPSVLLGTAFVVSLLYMRKTAPQYCLEADRQAIELLGKTPAEKRALVEGAVYLWTQRQRVHLDYRNHLLQDPGASSWRKWWDSYYYTEQGEVQGLLWSDTPLSLRIQSLPSRKIQEMSEK